MGVSCCKNENERNDDIESCENISDIRNYVATKIENAEIEQEEIKIYLQDNKIIPKTVDITGFSEEDIKKRLIYLDEMKNCLNEVDDLLKKHPNVNIIDIKNSLKEYEVMYTWIYDDSKRYVEWLKLFKNFTENYDKIESEII